jgi:hypothetical protein
MEGNGSQKSKCEIVISTNSGHAFEKDVEF